MAVEITCPTCGTVSHLEEVSRDAIAFCCVCDYPLFWVRSAQLASTNGSDSQAGLKRLPGTAGRIALATIACPECNEPNSVTSSICIRCGAELRPAPAPPPPPPPPPPPAPVVVAPPPPAPVKRRIWPKVVAAVLAVIAIALILYLTL